METIRKCNKARNCPVTDCWARTDHVCHPTSPVEGRVECRSTGWWVKCEPIPAN